MLNKNEVKDIQSLCHKKHRDEDGLFIAEGPKLAAELLQGGIKIVKIYALAGWIKDNLLQDVTAIEVTEKELARISQLQTPNQVVVVARQKAPCEQPVLKDHVVLVLDGIQDPGNMGTLVRIADWFGITQVVAGEDTADLYNLKVVQASMGSICRVQVWYKNLADWITTVDVPVYGAMLNGKSIYETGKISEGVLVTGNEGRGIKEAVAAYVSHPVTIPNMGGAESLNAAVATGIIVSHLIGR